MQVIQNLVPASKYKIKCPNTMKAEFYVVHNTASDASARNEIKYMISNDKETSYHYAIDDKEIIQGILETKNGWHAGDGNGSGNRKGIGIEICYSKSGGARFIQAEKNAVKFIAKGLSEKGWNVKDNIRKHQDFSGKYCPHRTLDMGWQRFLNMIQAELDSLESKVKIRYKGKVHSVDGYVKDQRNYVQLRETFETLGFRVDWDNVKKEVIIK